MIFQEFQFKFIFVKNNYHSFLIIYKYYVIGKNEDPVLDNVTVNQLSILSKSTNAQEIVRLK